MEEAAATEADAAVEEVMLEEEVQEDGIRCGWQYVFICYLLPLTIGGVNGCHWAPASLHFQANGWELWHLGVVSLVSFLARTLVTRLLVTVGTWTALLISLAHFGCALVGLLFADNEAAVLVQLFGVIALDIYVGAEALAFSTFGDSESNAKIACGAVTQHTVIAYACSSSIGGILFDFGGWRGVSTYHVFVQIVQTLLLLVTVKEDLLELCGFEVYADEELQQALEEAAKATAASAPRKLSEDDTASLPSSEAVSSTASARRLSLASSSENVKARGRRTSIDSVASRQGRRTSMGSMASGQGRRTSMASMLSGRGRRTSMASGGRGRRASMGSMMSGWTTSSRRSWSSLSESGVRPGHLRRVMIDARRASLVSYVSVNQALMGMDMMNFADDADNAAEDEEDQAEEGARKSRVSRSSRTKTAFPKDLYLPSLLVSAFGCFSFFTYQTEWSTYGLFFKDVHGWNEATWSGLAQTAGDVLAAIVMKLQNCLCRQSIDDEQNFDAGGCSWLMASILGKPYVISVMCLLYSACCFGMAAESLVLATTAQVLMGSVFIVSFQTCANMSTFYSLGDPSLFMQLQVMKQNGESVGSAVAGLTSLIIYAELGPTAPFLLTGFLFLGFFVIYTAAFCMRVGFGKSLDIQEARHRRRVGSVRTSGWKSQPSKSMEDLNDAISTAAANVHVNVFGSEADNESEEGSKIEFEPSQKETARAIVQLREEAEVAFYEVEEEQDGPS